MKCLNPFTGFKFVPHDFFGDDYVDDNLTLIVSRATREVWIFGDSLEEFVNDL